LKGNKVWTRKGGGLVIQVYPSRRITFENRVVTYLRGTLDNSPSK
jgi:hypothetical protein